MVLGPQPLVAAQWPAGSLGLVKQELVGVAMMEEEQVWMVALTWEEGVVQVVKKVPPSSSS